MAGEIVQSAAKRGENGMVDAKAIVDQDCVLVESVRSVVGVSLFRNVVFGSQVFVGASNNVKHDLALDERCTVVAGALAVQDVPLLAFVSGLPARVVAT